MRLYNTPDKKVVDLGLSHDRAITLYTCGPTVYDYPHIGNWYTFIRYDLLNRTLKANGYETNWVMNITDVGHLVSDSDEGEDKLEKGAKREGKTAWNVARFYGDYFVEGLKRLNFSDITHLPKATDYIQQQIDLVKKLEDKGYTYQIDDGVYFDTSKFADYAKFANLNLSKQEEGARVEANDQKRNSSDFALWKTSPKDEKRDMEWDSPWGKGFPGWHLECSAMIHEILGEPIDIHAGGIDHIQIHHTNEIAQTEAAFGHALSRYWMHCNHIQVDGKKMSKSLNNFFTLEDIEYRGYSLDVFRLHVLGGHYRSESQFSWESLDSTRTRLTDWQESADLRFQTVSYDEANKPMQDAEFAPYEIAVREALSEDLNSPMAITAIHQALEQVKLRNLDNTALEAFINFLIFVREATGINLLTTEDITDDQKESIVKLDEARKASNWIESDLMRDKLSVDGISIRNTPRGSFWSRRI